MSYNIKIVRPNSRSTIPTSEMKSGDIGIIKGGVTFDNHLVMRAYNQLISLTEPNSTWLMTKDFPAFEIELLPPGTTIELVVDNRNSFK